LGIKLLSLDKGALSWLLSFTVWIPPCPQWYCLHSSNKPPLHDYFVSRSAAQGIVDTSLFFPIDDVCTHRPGRKGKTTMAGV